MAPNYLTAVATDDAATAKANCLNLLRALATDPARHLPTLRLLLIDTRHTLLPVVVDFLLSSPRSPATDNLVTMLMTQGDLTKMLTDPGACSTGRALALTRIVHAVDPSLDSRLCQVLARLDVETPEGRCQALRILFLLDGLPPSARTLPVLMRLMRSGDKAIRSKVVKLVGAGKRYLHVLETYARDPDPRVRANAIESLWGADTPEMRTFFSFASSDPHPRVAANAVIGLYLLQDREARNLLERMAQSQDARFQASAAWAMGRCGAPEFVPSLRNLMESPRPTVRQSALRSLVAINSQQIQSSG